MANTNASSTSAEADLKALKEQYETLKSEMKAMTDLVGTTVTDKASSAKNDAIARVEMLSEEAKLRATVLQSDAERAILANPLAAVAICAGVGFVIGALTRR